jgi:hypothetical protein
VHKEYLKTNSRLEGFIENVVVILRNFDMTC